MNDLKIVKIFKELICEMFTTYLLRAIKIEGFLNILKS